MRVVFLSGSRSSAAGGIFEVERSIAHRLNVRHGIQIEAAGLLDTGTARDELAWESTKTHCFPIEGPRQFGYSTGLRDWLRASNHDVSHLHNLWMYMSVLALSWHRRTKRPFIVSPHGMLDPWALKNSVWKKRLAGILYERRMLRNAAVIHAFHQKDLHDIRDYGLRNPVAVIPNGVDIPSIVADPSRRENRLLFLGRLHPKKGLAEMIDGWAKISPERRGNWKLTIAGWDDGGHLPGLQERVEANQLQSSVEFIGPVFGDEKQRLLESSSGFILPSYSEGLPMTVLEAWANSIPVIMTRMCNLPEGFESSAAIEIDPTPESIASGIQSFLNLPMGCRQELGVNGRKLVERRFTWDSVADRTKQTYEWMLGAHRQPDFIHTAR